MGRSYVGGNQSWRTYRDRIHPSAGGTTIPPNLEALKKSELTDLAAELGVPTTATMTKTEIIEAILEVA